MTIAEDKCSCASLISTRHSDFLRSHCPARSSDRPANEDACALASYASAMDDLKSRDSGFYAKHRAPLEGFLETAKDVWISPQTAGRNRTGRLLETCLVSLLTSTGLNVLNPAGIRLLTKQMGGLYCPDVAVRFGERVCLIESTGWPESNKLRSAIFSGLVATEAGLELAVFAATLWEPGANDPTVEGLIRFGVDRGYLKGVWGFRSLPAFFEAIRGIEVEAKSKSEKRRGYRR